ncbi:hypothetical protein BOC46_20870 [Burkholderia pseudomallei]|nr:hypothetical protein BOC46_20870 [Burkholderia pseudomallei]
MARRRSGHASASGRRGARSRGASPAPSHIRRIRPTFGPHSAHIRPTFGTQPEHSPNTARTQPEYSPNTARTQPEHSPNTARIQPEYIRRTLVPRRDGRAFRESPDFRSPGAMQ